MQNQIILPILLLLLGLSNLVNAQVKIGDNPETINPTSVLELESTNRVLVITRVDADQMATISPSRGALVYNTTEECIFYHNGSNWISLCGEGASVDH